MSEHPDDVSLGSDDDDDDDGHHNVHRAAPCDASWAQVS